MATGKPSMADLAAALSSPIAVVPKPKRKSKKKGDVQPSKKSKSSKVAVQGTSSAGSEPLLTDKAGFFSNDEVTGKANPPPSTLRRGQIQSSPPPSSPQTSTEGKVSIFDPNFDGLHFIAHAYSDDFSQEFNADEFRALALDALYFSQRASTLVARMFHGAQPALSAHTDCAETISSNNAAINNLNEELEKAKKVAALAEKSVKEKSDALKGSEAEIEKLTEALRVSEEAAMVGKEAIKQRDEEMLSHDSTKAKLAEVSGELALLKKVMDGKSATYLAMGFQNAQTQALLLRPDLEIDQMMVFGEVVDGKIVGPPNPEKIPLPEDFDAFLESSSDSEDDDGGNDEGGWPKNGGRASAEGEQ